MEVICSRKELVNVYREKLGSSPQWAVRGLLAVYDKQTADEKMTETTTHHNGVGFRGCDAEFLSSLAVQYNKYGRLSEKQLASLMKVMPVYASQLVAISIESGRVQKEGKYYVW